MNRKFTSEVNSFQPDRLREARESRGLTIIELAEGVGISHQSISKYENGKANPGHLTLNKICNELNFPVQFMLKSPLKRNEKVTYFRSRANATVKSKKIHQSRLGWVEEIYSFIQEILQLPETNIPIINDSKSFEPTPYGEIENIAQNLRRRFGIGNGPISDVVLLLEKNGAIISRSEFGDFRIDACSKWNDTNQRPFIMLGNDKNSAARSRFDIAHELGHLILHPNLTWAEFNNKTNYKIIEKEANYFATAFLLPSSSFGSEIYSTSMESLINLKKRWKVSIQAIAYRARELDLITPHQFVNVRRRLAKKDWLQKEPLDDALKVEEPRILKEAITMIIDHHVISREELIATIGLSTSDIEVLANIPSGYLIEEPIVDESVVINFKRRGSR
ncbi:helix-turn-helix domain-containing protein [Halobacillus sp. H74]|uniref:helix-turn-helix domain-containing protein n=1 Tax=Halobacillus sp. H74 TaxID=3457436 RepID=UPI003FCEB146